MLLDNSVEGGFVTAFGVQRQRTVDVKRLRDFCASAVKATPAQLAREVKTILLQHCLQELLQGLTQQPLASDAQASFHLMSGSFIESAC